MSILVVTNNTPFVFQLVNQEAIELGKDLEKLKDFLYRCPWDGTNFEYVYSGKLIKYIIHRNLKNMTVPITEVISL